MLNAQLWQEAVDQLRRLDDALQRQWPRLVLVLDQLVGALAAIPVEELPADLHDSHRQIVLYLEVKNAAVTEHDSPS